LDWLTEHNPDVLCLQETKVQDKDFPTEAFKNAGYRAVYTGQKAYNGVAVISKLPGDMTRLNLYDSDGEDARFIRTRINEIPLINVYVPQGYEVGSDKFEYKLRWLTDLLDFVKNSYDPAMPLIVAGDFNIALEPIDVYDPDQFRGKVAFHPDEQAIFQEFLGWGLVDVFRKHRPEGGKYTFWDYRIPNGFKRNLGWRIDYILATPPLAGKSQNAWIDREPRSRPKPSDHTFLIAEFQIDH
jgi:exodeoxyribonuclease-3